MEMTQTDWITISVSLVAMIAGIYILGRREADGAWGLGLWDARIFASFLVFLGAGILGMWFSNGELLDAGWQANTMGFVTAISLTIAAVSASVFDKDAPLPDWSKNLVALLGLGILFASGLTITVQSFYNADFSGEFLGVTMPLFPMNEFLASIWAAGLLSLCGAALLGLVSDAKKVVD